MAGNGKFAGREVVIVEAVRTPVGRGLEEKGYYKDVHSSNLLARTFTEVNDRSGIEPSEVEDVVAGCVQQFGEQAYLAELARDPRQPAGDRAAAGDPGALVAVGRAHLAVITGRAIGSGFLSRAVSAPRD